MNHGKRRALGQHFLRDPQVIQQITECVLQLAQTTHCSSVLEIGPGRGALTWPLIHGLKHALKPGVQFQKLRVVERDEKLAQYWQTQAKLESISQGISLAVEAQDFMQLEEASWLEPTPMLVVSNLPYASGTAILNRLAQHPECIPVMVLMFQSEVAQRLRAEVSSSSRGSLSVWIQNRWEVKTLVKVSPQSFLPPPQVHSEVVILTARPAPLVLGTADRKGAELFEMLLKNCFAQRRKMLRSGLTAHPKLRRAWQNALVQSGVDGTKRAEALHWQEWNQLFRALQQVPELSHSS